MLVAKYGDACNLFGRMGNEVVQHKLDVLRQHCQEVGRDYNTIEKTTLDSLQITSDGRDGSMTPKAVIEYCRALAEIGIDQAIFSLRNVSDLEPFDLLRTEIVPEVEKISVAGR